MAQQLSHLAGPGAAVRLLDGPQPVLGGELTPGGLDHNLRIRGSPVLLTSALGASSLRSLPPRAEVSASIPVIESISARIGILFGRAH